MKEKLQVQVRLADLVARLGGELVGDGELRVSGIAPVDSAGPSHVTFLSNRKLRSRAAESRAAALVLSPADHAVIGNEYAGARVLTSNPYAWFARAAQHFVDLTRPTRLPGVHETAVIAGSAVIASTCFIGPNVTVEEGASIGDHCVIEAGCFIGRDVQIGAGSHLSPNVSFLEACIIGVRGVVHAGAVIGSEGFGFANEDGAWIRIPQTGRVVIGDDVQIGASTTIDRGALADTVIERGVKLDNQIQIAHNCRIGENTAMAGCVGVAGSAIIGRNCTFGGAAMVLGHLSIADNVHVSSGSLVSRSIHEAGQYTGFYPLAKNADWERSAVIVRNLDSLRDRIRELEKTVATLATGKDSQDSQDFHPIKKDT